MLRTLLLISFCAAFWAGAQFQFKAIANFGSGNSYEYRLWPDGSRTGGLSFQSQRYIIFSGEVGFSLESENHMIRTTFGSIQTNIRPTYRQWSPSFAYGYFIKKDKGILIPFVSFSSFHSKDYNAITNEKSKYHMVSIGPGIGYRWKILEFSYHLSFILDGISDQPYRYEDPQNNRRLSNFKIGIVVPLKK